LRKGSSKQLIILRKFCETMVSSKRFHEILNQVPADYYDQGVKTNLFQKYWHQKKWRTLKKFLKESAKGSFLDIGCADGTTTFQIYKNFPNLKITGLDYYRKAIEFARRTKPQIKFVIADVHKLPFPNRSFDIVSAIETLEHVQNPHEALAEIKRVLKPGGFLIIVQDTNSLLFRSIWWLWTRWKGSVWKNSHINCMESKKLFRVLRKSGFKIEHFEYTNLKMEVFIKAQKHKY